jgi:hypothetical protein
VIEYQAIFEIVRISNNIDDTDQDDNEFSPGRKPNATFAFHPNHPLYHSHIQRLRSKQMTLIYNAHPPKHPGLPPTKPNVHVSSFEKYEYKTIYNKWLKQADAFACYYSILFLPHPAIYGDRDLMKSIHSYEDYLSWSNFARRIKDMEFSGLLIDRQRLHCMQNYIYQFKQNNYANKQLMENYRFRNATYWTEEEKEKANKKFAQEYHATTTIFDTDTEHNATDMENEKNIQNGIKFSSSQIKNALNETNYCAIQNATIMNLFGTRQNNNHTVQVQNQHGQHTDQDDSIYFELNPEKLKDTCSDIQYSKFKFINNTQENTETTNNRSPRNLKRNRNGEFIDSEVQAQVYIEGRNLKRRQLIIVAKVFEYFKQVLQYKRRTKHKPSLFELSKNGIKAPKFLVTGDPGTGKSYLTDTICELANIMKVGFVATTSYNGIAAVNIDGNTIASMFHIHDSNTGKFQDEDIEKIQTLRNDLNSDEMCFLIVDEVSTIDCRIIAMLHIRLQQIFDNDLEFGGLPIMFTGDFNQLGPVKKLHTKGYDDMGKKTTPIKSAS